MEDLFHMLHIQESITGTLTFTDLLKCILVNRTWHNLFIPLLWSDVITYRSIPTAKYRQWEYLDYSLTPHGRQALIKYGSLIGAVTCKGTSSLKVLAEANCINIVEIEYDAEWIVDNNYSGPGLAELASWIRLHPTLETISIKNLSYVRPAIELFQFLNVLDTQPHITNIYIDSNSVYDEHEERFQFQNICGKTWQQLR
ncbi:hypothetical protein BGZ74_002270 [Mortierella antarctica]|nr:hypothetical protein BGZ74_002270 [Mortierella antarctica]